MPPKNQDTKAEGNKIVVPGNDKPDVKPRKKITRHWFLNPYLLGLVALITIGSVVAYYAYKANQSTINIDGQSVDSSTISQEDFAELAAGQAEIDSTNKTLNVAANSIFDGTMLVRSSLDVQGQLRVGGELTLNELAVAGQSTLNNLDVANDLAIQGNTQFNGAVSMQSDLTVAGSLIVAGSTTFAGNLSANSIEAGSLSFNGNLRMNGHIITSGPQTGASSGGAVGSGGTVSVNGNDIAGTVNINTGGSPSSGILVSVSFGRSYSQTPRVNVTPVGAGAGALNWYITRNASGFTIRTTSAPPAASNFGFDYFIVE